jgi:hypothetical protein
MRVLRQEVSKAIDTISLSRKKMPPVTDTTSNTISLFSSLDQRSDLGLFERHAASLKNAFSRPSNLLPVNHEEVSIVATLIATTAIVILGRWTVLGRPPRFLMGVLGISTSTSTDIGYSIRLLGGCRGSFLCSC